MNSITFRAMHDWKTPKCKAAKLFAKHFKVTVYVWWFICCMIEIRLVVVVVVVYFILSRLLYLAFSANLGLLCMPHPGMGPLV